MLSFYPYGDSTHFGGTVYLTGYWRKPDSAVVFLGLCSSIWSIGINLLDLSERGPPADRLFKDFPSNKN